MKGTRSSRGSAQAPTAARRQGTVAWEGEVLPIAEADAADVHRQDRTSSRLVQQLAVKSPGQMVTDLGTVCACSAGYCPAQVHNHHHGRLAKSPERRM